MRKEYKACEKVPDYGCPQNKFTLIELLVVVAIISILMTILLPALSMVKEKTKRLSCLNNQKQLGTVLMSYGNDFNSCLPPVTNQASYYLSNNSGAQNLGALVPNHLPISDSRIFWCPAQAVDAYSYDHYETGSDYPFVSDIPGVGFPNRATGMNYTYRGRDPGGMARNTFPQDGLRLTDGPGIAVLADWAFKSGTEWRINHLRGGLGTCKGFNVLYLDGHAAWYMMGYDELSALNPQYYLNASGTWDWYYTIGD